MFFPTACDMYINETGQFLTSPGFPDAYENNLDCVLIFESLDESLCVRLTVLEAYLEGPEENGICEKDYLEVSRLGRFHIFWSRFDSPQKTLVPSRNRFQEIKEKHKD